MTGDSVLWPTVHPNVLLTYLRDGEHGLAELEASLERKARSQPGGKFGKGEAAYVPKSPLPPLLWRYSCGRCRFWEDGEPGTPGHCHIVGREGDRWGGEDIHQKGWCALWMPPKGEPAFDWVREQLNPTGADTVWGEYDAPRK